MKQLILILSAVILSSASYGITRYVSPAGDGAQTGTSWLNAAPGSSLQAVINASSPGDEVWVACGIYTPTGTSNRSLSFSMKNGVTIYGSFSGTESSLSQRTFTCGPCSVLSGDIGQPGNASDNSYHVVSNPVGLNNTAVIDGFIVQDGNDNRPIASIDGLGGGFFNNGGNSGNICSPAIRNCLIRNNAAQFGGGIFNSGQSGGNSSPLITNCIITNNSAYMGGGGIDNFGLNGVASPTITNCIVYSNNAVQRAGGMYCWGGNNGNANPLIVNCAFVNNTANDGGGIVSDRENSPSGSFSGNSNPVALNSVFFGNLSTNIGPQFFLIGNATFSATYSNISLAGQTSPHVMSGSGTGNILNINPQLLSTTNAMGADNCWFTADDGLRLQGSSPLIDAGSSLGAPATDIMGTTRSGALDIGAYEYSPVINSVADHSTENFSLYPNPVSSELTVSFTDNVPHPVQVYNVYGTLIQSEIIRGSGSLNLSAYAGGFYFIKINGKQAQKFIKE